MAYQFVGAKADPLARKSLSEVKSQLAEITNQGQIKGMIILTQADYDALPATKETDGVIYLIRG